MLGEPFPRILDAAKAGGDWAWRELYRNIAPALARFLRARGTPDAEDVVGQTFMSVVRTIGTFSGDERAFRAWVFAIARNATVDAHRARARRPLVQADDRELEAAGPTGDVEDDAMAELSRSRVVQLLEVLSPEQRDVLLMRILGDLTIGEVATVLGRSTGSVKMLQSRGLEALRRAISRGAVTV